MEMNRIASCREAANRMRRSIIEMTYHTGSAGAHLGGSLSLVDLLAGLYLGVIHFRPNDPHWECRDRVILSKGHAAMALYTAMAEAGIIEKSELANFKKDGSRLGGHPSLNGLPGIEFASGSLGQGLSQGVGVALALKRKNNQDSRVFVIMGDGECDEGSVWEAAASASHYQLDDLVAIIDRNAMQYDGYTEDVLNMTPIVEKWQDFGWDTLDIDGHDMEEILKAYRHRGSRPLAIIAHTVKGKGISFMENNRRFHNATLTNEQYVQAIEELKAAT